LLVYNYHDEDCAPAYILSKYGDIVWNTNDFNVAKIVLNGGGDYTLGMPYNRNYNVDKYEIVKYDPSPLVQKEI